MPSLIKPGTVRVLTQDGEVQVSITLELNINLNTEGVLQVSGQSMVKKEVEKESVEWAIPDFNESPKIDFGKQE